MLPAVFDLVDSVKGCDSIALGIGWVIEDLVNEIVDLSIEAHSYLPNVHHLRSPMANDMDPKNL